MIKASRQWMITFAFVASAVLGGPVLVLWGVVIGYGSFLLHRRDHAVAGIYAVADGFSAPAVATVMLVCGITGAVVAYFRLKR